MEFRDIEWTAGSSTPPIASVRWRAMSMCMLSGTGRLGRSEDEGCEGEWDEMEWEGIRGVWGLGWISRDGLLGSRFSVRG